MGVSAEPRAPRSCCGLGVAAGARWERIRNDGEEEKVMWSQFVLAQGECKALKVIF